MFTKTAPIISAKKNGHHPAFLGKERGSSSFIPSVQTKLDVGEPNSIYEVEAERMADHVVGASTFYSPTSFISPSPIQTATKTVGPTTEKDPDILIEGILPPKADEENEVISDVEPEQNPQEEKPETAEPSIPDLSIEKPDENKEGSKAEKTGAEGEEKEEELVAEAQKEGDISAEDAAAFQGEANLEPIAPVEITPELSNQFIQTKPQEVQLTEETEPEEDSESIQEKIHAKFAADGNEDEETGTLQRNGFGVVNASSKVEQGITNGKKSGETMSSGTLQHMGSRFGADFSNVKIHTDGNAQSMNNELRARAFTYKNHIYFNRNQYNPTSKDGQHLLAHELTHTLQQGAAVQRKPQITQTKPKVQKLGIGDALDYFADKANHIPGYRMFTVILGLNPINMSSVDRSAGNIIRAMVEFLPGGKLITDALDEHGIFSRVSSWFKEQMDSLSITGTSIRSAINEFLDSLSWSDIFNLGDVWRRAKRIFTTPIKRLISFAKSLVKQIMDWVKEAILRPLALLAEGTPAYDLLRVALGSDPITGDAYPPTAENLIGGFMTLIGQEEIWENIKKGNAIERAFAWFKGALSGLMDFVTSIPTTIIETLKSLTWQDIVLVVGAFQKIGKAFLNVASKFMSWAGGTVLELLEIIFSVVSPSVVPWLKKAGGAFSNILQNPIGFVGNLVNAAKQGFMKFAANIGKHLKQALINWLMGSLAGAGVYIPQSLSIKEIIKFVLSVLGISWANLRIKLVKHLGESAVKALETGFELVTLLVTKGPLAMWERIKEQLTDLKAMVIGEITSWVVTKVVTKAITKLVTSLNPAGAVIQAILFIYDTVTFLIDKISQIARVGMAVLNSMMAIASGAIGAAVQKVEQTLAGMLSLAISFLANFLGLGKISKKIVGIVKKVQKKVDTAIDKVIGWIVGKAKAFLKKLVTAGTPKDPKERLKVGMKKAVGAVNKLSGKVTEVLINPILAGIKIRYQFQTLSAYKKGGVWWIKGKINPEDEQPTNARTEGEAESNPISEHFGKQLLKNKNAAFTSEGDGLREPIQNMGYTFVSAEGTYHIRRKSADGTIAVHIDDNGILQQGNKSGTAEHGEYKPIIKSWNVVEGGIEIKYGYEDEIHQNKTFTTLVEFGKEAKPSTKRISSKGENITLKKSGTRGRTDSSGSILGAKFKELVGDNPVHSAHLIADWFTGSGSAGSGNLIPASKDYNTKTMFGVEKDIADKFSDGETFALQVSANMKLYPDTAVQQAIAKEKLAEAEGDDAGFSEKEIQKIMAVLSKELDPMYATQTSYGIEGQSGQQIGTDDQLKNWIE